MQVRQTMTANLTNVTPDASVQSAADLMRTADVGVLPVSKDAELVGLLTDRDIVVRAVAEGRDVKNTKVAEVMTRQLVCCYDDADVSEAARLMGEKKVRRLVVVNRQKEAVGILSLGDIARAPVDDTIAGTALRQVSARGPGSP